MRRILLLFVLLLVGVLSTGCNFSTSISAGKVSVEKPSGMSFNNVLIQKTAGKELKEFKAFIDTYFDKINVADDKYIYDNLLHTAFYDKYSFTDIENINKTIRSWGKIESYDLDKAELSIKKDSMNKEYNVVMPVKFETSTKKCTIKLISENGILKIQSFDFTSM